MSSLEPFAGMDFKGWFRTGDDGQRCDPFTITDAHSRYFIRCQAIARMDRAHVRYLGVHHARVRSAAFNQKGVGASRSSDVFMVSSIVFDFADTRVNLITPARILTKPTLGQVLGGNLGTDLLGQTGGWAIDFSSMTLSLSGGDNSTRLR